MPFAVEKEPSIVYFIPMVFMRFILLIILAYYLLKLFTRWILGVSGGRGSGRGGAAEDPDSERYRELTDQEIEDADYEEIVTKDE